jgi:hypothetical protein
MEAQRRSLMGAGDSAGAHALPDRPAEHLSNFLSRRASGLANERITLGEIAEMLGERSIGALLLLLALPMTLPVPTPGLSIIFGLPMIVVAAQLALRRRHVWLPGTLARRALGRADFLRLIEHLRPALRRLERVVRPRAAWFAGDWAKIPVGLTCLALAIIITLPIPMGHVVPGTAISVLALGLVEQDGVAVALRLLVAILGLVLVTIASAGLTDGLYHWLWQA